MKISIRQVAVLLSALIAFAGLAPTPAAAQTAASAPLAPATPGARTQPIQTGVPAGFEADTSFETVFDVDFQGVRVGSFKGTLANGVFRFSDPAAVVAALGDKIDRPKALALVSQGMNSNEAFRCVPGQKTNCDLLPPGISGVIVDPETFRVDLFLGREFLLATKAGPRLLPDPISGPSLVQGVMLAVSSDLIDQSGVHAGATFDTAASIGRNAFISQIAAGDQQGFQADQMYLQRVQGGWRAAAGLMTSPSEAVLTNFNFVGADWASFQPTSLDNPNAGTPLDVLLPRHARVELYANGTLVSAQQYDGGLQLIDTSLLPTGSYNRVRIIARDGGSTVILDQTDAPSPRRPIFRLPASSSSTSRRASGSSTRSRPRSRRPPCLAAASSSPRGSPSFRRPRASWCFEPSPATASAVRPPSPRISSSSARTSIRRSAFRPIGAASPD